MTPDIPFKQDKVDFIELGKASCPGDFDIPPGTGKFIWPSQFQALSGGDFKEGHPGLDLSTPSGTPVYAADTGLVIFAGWTGIGYGNTIVIDHGNGYRTLYGHLSQVSTYCGAKVEAGVLIGLSGSTGNSSGPHLHFEVRVPDGYINPLRVLPIP
jgi:murein DD-endopeptidase MepM/ murein hydrolase activator NlpD